MWPWSGMDEMLLAGRELDIKAGLAPAPANGCPPGCPVLDPFKETLRLSCWFGSRLLRCLGFSFMEDPRSGHWKSPGVSGITSSTKAFHPSPTGLEQGAVPWSWTQSSSEGSPAPRAAERRWHLAPVPMPDHSSEGWWRRQRDLPFAGTPKSAA